MPHTKRRLLVVDDDHECRLMLSALVAQAGFDADAVADGPMALTMLDARPPDLVLLDAHLPGVDGWEVCRQIKARDAHKHTPVIMLTAYATDDARSRSLDAGADVFIPKPFRAQPLLELIDNLLQIRDTAEHLDMDADVLSSKLRGPNGS